MSRPVTVAATRPISLIAFAAGALFMSSMVSAQDRTPSPFVSMDEIGSADEQIEVFLSERGWVRGECSCNPAGGTLVVAEADIAVSADQIRFSEARLMATEEAYLTAVGIFARQDSVEIVKESTKTFMKDDLPQEIEQEDNLDALLSAVSTRLATASVAQLDKLISSLGGDTSNLPQLSLSAKRKRLHDEMLVESLSRASARMAGVGIFGVIEQTGGDGVLSNGSVNVVVVRAPGFEDLGRQLRSGESNAALGMPVDSIRKKLAGHMAARTPMLGYFGVQPVKDAEGRYGLISFGMGAPQLVRSMDQDDMRAEYDMARMSAELMADGWLAQFASLAVTADRSEVRRTLKQKIDVMEGDGFIHKASSTDVGKLLSDVTRSISKANIRGIQTIGSWSADAPDTGHPYLGVVKYWSPAMAASAESLSDAYRNGTRPTVPAAAKPAAAPAKSNRSTGAFGEW
ncbi:hypothetical protein [Granulosicoccus antarcticus]|uniref:Uncharacterized protein n=1 Tax=Granulosicoccus antarcticus IMCC3135 TaxID=1192854 RepID=A0A2Z2NZH0_9GAMM|nr:hypothetical protein [Granulosicoccus antarcticus]ASJ76663.1 hypothetical protein IMCC3135_33095 [Granulosicoccus antarcticus IMCC3135]